MLSQRETDIAIVESKAEIQKLLQEWAVDYLGSRLDGENIGRGREAEGADAQATEGAGIAEGAEQAPY